jgi:hypothetical protein
MPREIEAAQGRIMGAPGRSPRARPVPLGGRTTL